MTRYAYYFSHMLQEDCGELDHGHAPHDQVNIEEEVQSITEPQIADESIQANMVKTPNEMVSEVNESVQLL